MEVMLLTAANREIRTPMVSFAPPLFFEASVMVSLTRRKADGGRVREMEKISVCCSAGPCEAERPRIASKRRIAGKAASREL